MGEITPGWETGKDWLPCDGRELDIGLYSALFAAIGIAWGGDVKKGKFNLPDLQGYFLRGVDAFHDRVVDTVDKDSVNNSIAMARR